MAHPTATEQGVLAVLCDASKRLQAAFNANNSFNLHFGLGAGNVSADDVRAQYRELLSADQLETMEQALAARQAAQRIAGQTFRDAVNALNEAGVAVLNACATPLGEGWYEFDDCSKPTKARAHFRGIDNCYRAKNGSICGSVRVSERGDGSTTTWLFDIQGGRMVVRTEPDAY